MSRSASTRNFQRVYFTARAFVHRAYFGPFSSAKRVRRTLDLLEELFPVPDLRGDRSRDGIGVPASTTASKRCQAPCVRYIDRDEYRRNIEAIMDFLSGRYREDRAGPRAGDVRRRRGAGVRARGDLRDRLAAVRSLMQRQRIASDVIGTADLIGVALDRADAHAQVFQVRDAWVT